MLRVPLIPRTQPSETESLPHTDCLLLDCLAEPTEAVRLLERCSRPGRGECWKGIRLADEFRIDDVNVQPTLCEPVSGYSYLELQHGQAPLALLNKRKKSKHIPIWGCSDSTREAIEKGAATEAAYWTAVIKKAMRSHRQIYITDPIPPSTGDHPVTFILHTQQQYRDTADARDRQHDQNIAGNTRSVSQFGASPTSHRGTRHFQSSPGHQGIGDGHLGSEGGI